MLESCVEGWASGWSHPEVAMLRDGKRVYPESYFEEQPREEQRLLWRSAISILPEPKVDGSSYSSIPSPGEGVVFSCARPTLNLLKAILAPTVNLVIIHGGGSFGLLTSRFSSRQNLLRSA